MSENKSMLNKKTKGNTMIKIKKSPTAVTRTCDWSKVTEKELLESSESHIADVGEGLDFFSDMLYDASTGHDEDKITPDGLKQFHADFKTGFKQTGWYEKHKKVSRHHIDKPEGIPHNVNLVDVLEHITDCVMAGMARSGSVYDLKLSDKLLQQAFQNTVELLKNNVEVVEEESP